MSDLPINAPSPRLCHITKWPDFDGYGFNLHADKSRPGQYIGKVDDNSPADVAGLKEGDRIIEVNGVNISNENHKQVVQRIKAVSNETQLLVVDGESDRWYKSHNLIVKGDQSNVIRGSSKRSPSPESAESSESPAPPSKTDSIITDEDNKSLGSASSSHSENSTQPQQDDLAKHNNETGHQEEASLATPNYTSSSTPEQECPDDRSEGKDSSEDCSSPAAREGIPEIVCTAADVPLEAEGQEDVPLQSEDRQEDVPLESEGQEELTLQSEGRQEDVPLEPEYRQDVPLESVASTEIPLESQEGRSDVPLEPEDPSSEVPLESDPIQTYDNVRFEYEENAHNAHKIECEENAHNDHKNAESQSASEDRHSLSSRASSSPSESLSSSSVGPPKADEPEKADTSPVDNQEERKSPMSTTPSPPPSIESPVNNKNSSPTPPSTINRTAISGLNLNMTAAEMRAHLKSKKKFDPRKDTIDLKKKYQIVQNM